MCFKVIGKVHGHYCMVSANDGTLKGGTFFPISLKKTLRAQDISRKNRLPIINLVDSGGAFLPLQVNAFDSLIFFSIFIINGHKYLH